MRNMTAITLYSGDPSIRLAPITDTSGLGPAMIRLNPQQRAFVVAFIETGGQDYTRAATIAGYCPDNQQARRVTAYRLAHDPKVQAAIKEVADKRLRSGAILAAEVLLQIAADPTHKDRLKASVELLNRAGLLVVNQTEVVHRTEDEADRVKRITEYCRTLGLDPRELLGCAGVTVDAEFKVVQNRRKPTSAPEPEPETVEAEVEDDWTVYPEEDVA